jgi:hypothetical protein
MNAKQKKQIGKSADLEIAFDVGHSSLGWAVLQNTAVFRRAVIGNQPRYYKPWTPKNSKWAG